jgi:nucleotide-binding universal stress UspA family protein
MTTLERTFERVLVPLDGSRLAEASLPAAKALARHLGSVLVLVHAIEEDPPEEVHGQPHLGSPAAAKEYLKHQRDLCLKEGLRAEVHVTDPQDADIAQAIAHLAERFDTGLVAMCAHGRQTLRDRFVGTIAQRALQGGGPPILLRTPGASPDLPMDIDHILVPVDFRHDLTATMEDLLTLAKGFDAAVTLLHAVDAGVTGLPARMLPNTALELSERNQEAARRHLSELRDRLCDEHIPTEMIISLQDPDDAIIECAHERSTDLIILVTRARSGVAAWYEHSVGHEVIGEPGLNLLLLRSPKE